MKTKNCLYINEDITTQKSLPLKMDQGIQIGQTNQHWPAEMGRTRILIKKKNNIV